MGSTASFGLFSLSSSVVRASNMVVAVSCLMAHLVTCGHLSEKEPVCLGEAEGFRAIALKPVT